MTPGVSGVKVYPMTFEQESIWLDDHLSGGPSRYLESWAYRLSGPLDADAAQWALARVVDRHEALRSRLTMLDDQLVQVVVPGHQTTLEHLNYAGDGLEEELRRLVQRPLDLNISPLRASLVHLSPAESVLVVQIHHAVVDTWALRILDEEFAHLYSARVAGRPADLAPVSLQLGEYASMQRKAGLSATALAYWQDRLRDVPVPRAPLADRPRPATRGHQGGVHRFRITPELGQRIRNTARARHSTPFTVFTAVLAALSCGYLGSAETVIGTPVSRRGASDVDGMIGCLTDLVPLRCAVAAHQEFADLIAATRAAVLGAMTHRSLPYSQIVARAVPRKRLRAAPLCSTTLVLDDDAPWGGLDLPEVTAKRLYVYSGSKFDLCLSLVIDEGGYDGSLEYACDLYDAPTVVRIADDMCAVLDEAAAHPDRAIGKILTGNGVV